MSGASAYLRQTSDSNMKAMLAALVHEANFLVEENLNILVDDIDEDERNLFKLDSILAAIGMEGEDEVLAILKRMEGSTSLSRTKGEILKTIRQHLEQQQNKSVSSSSDNDNNYHPAKAKKKSSASARLGPGAGGDDQQQQEQQRQITADEEEMQEWNAMIASIGQLVSEDRQQMLEEVKKFDKSLKNVETLKEQNRRLEVQIQEMKTIYENITGEKVNLELLC